MPVETLASAIGSDATPPGNEPVNEKLQCWRFRGRVSLAHADHPCRHLALFVLGVPLTRDAILDSVVRTITGIDVTNTPLILEVEHGVAVLRLNRPERRNALDLEMRQQLAACFEQVNQDSSVRAAVLTGGDQVFAAGADLKLMVQQSAASLAELNLPQYYQPLLDCPVPVVAAVNGFALGAGCEVAMMCDLIVADETARFGQPECNVGIMPGAGGTQRLLRAVGRPVASLMTLTGSMIDADRAYQLGLVSELTGPGQAMGRALELAQKMTGLPPLALNAIKRSLRAGAELPLADALAEEHRLYLSLFDTQDQVEGMSAFLEKRKPKFEGR